MTAAAEMPEDIAVLAEQISLTIEERIRSKAFDGPNGPKLSDYLKDRFSQAILSARQRDQWQPISEADRSIATVQTFPDVSITLRNSYPVWVRDEDGRVYEAVWSEGTANYWWDLEGESPVDPVEFMPHPLDPRFAAPKGGDHHG